MTRHSAHLDEKLLKTGIDLIADEGIKSLTVRKICQKADANLGMFIYFFKNKENYLKHIFTEIQTQLDKALQMDKTIGLNPMEQLRYLLKNLIRFASENGNLSRAMLIDFATEETLYKKYIQKGIITPQKWLFDLIKTAQEKGYITSTMGTEELHEFLLFSVVFPPVCPTLAQLPLGNKSVIKHDLEYYYKRCDNILKYLEEKNHA